MKKLFKLFIALMLSLSLALLMSCGGGKEPSKKLQGPPVPPSAEDNPIEWPSDWEGVDGPIVDYVP